MRARVMHIDIEDSKDTTYYDSWRVTVLSFPDHSHLTLAAGTGLIIRKIWPGFSRVDLLGVGKSAALAISCTI